MTLRWPSHHRHTERFGERGRKNNLREGKKEGEIFPLIRTRKDSVLSNFLQKTLKKDTISIDVFSECLNTSVCTFSLSSYLFSPSSHQGSHHWVCIWKFSLKFTAGFHLHSSLHFAHAPSLHQHQYCPQWISAFLILTIFIKTGGIIHRFPREIPDDVPTSQTLTSLAAFFLVSCFPLLGSNISLDSAGAVSFT